MYVPSLVVYEDTYIVCKCLLCMCLVCMCPHILLDCYTCACILLCYYIRLHEA